MWGITFDIYSISPVHGTVCFFFKMEYLSLGFVPHYQREFSKIVNYNQSYEFQYSYSV